MNIVECGDCLTRAVRRDIAYPKGNPSECHNQRFLDFSLVAEIPKIRRVGRQNTSKVIVS